MTDLYSEALKRGLRAMAEVDKSSLGEEEALTCLTAGITAYLAAQWRPIESAPKEHKPGELQPPLIGLWIPAIGNAYGRYADERYAKKPRPYWSYHTVMGVGYQRANQPTHWQPLPPPPPVEGKT